MINFINSMTYDFNLFHIKIVLPGLKSIFVSKQLGVELHIGKNPSNGGNFFYPNHTPDCIM